MTKTKILEHINYIEEKSQCYPYFIWCMTLNFIRQQAELLKDDKLRIKINMWCNGCELYESLHDKYELTEIKRFLSK